MLWSADEMRKRTGNPRQFAAVRQITLNDGPSMGMRALAFSTGGGLDFWVFSDRSMDIGRLGFTLRNFRRRRLLILKVTAVAVSNGLCLASW